MKKLSAAGIEIAIAGALIATFLSPLWNTGTPASNTQGASFFIAAKAH